MAKCDLEILLDRADGPYYRLGEKVTGRVCVRAHKNCHCRKLVLTHSWYTQGSGNADRGWAERQVLFEGAWQAGEIRTYPFTFDVPPGPLSYWGRYLSVAWKVEARAYLPWSRDPKAAAGFAVLPGPTDQPFRSGREPRKKRSHRLLTYAGLVLAGLLASCLLSLDDEFLLRLGIAVGSLVGMIAALVLLVRWATRNKRTRARLLGKVDVWINPEVLRPGESLTYALRLCTEGTIHVTRATAELVGCEQATYVRTTPTSLEGGVSTETDTYTALLHQEQKTLTENREIAARAPVVFEGSFRLPDNAACTFTGSSNSVKWTLKLALSLTNGHTWAKDYSITIRP